MVCDIRGNDCLQGPFLVLGLSMVAEELATFPNEAQFQVINSASSLPTPKNGARRLLIVILEVGASIGVRGHFKIQLLFIAWRVACL